MVRNATGSFFWMLVLLCLTGVTAEAEEAFEQFSEHKPHTLRTRCWVPAEPDADTFRLYRMEDGKAARIDAAALDELGEVPDAMLDVGKPDDGGTPLKDDSKLPESPSKVKALVTGQHEFVKDGRFGRGLRLKGGKSVITCPLASAGASMAVHAWFKPEKLSGTLLWLTARRGPLAAVECRLQTDGKLAVFINGKLGGTSRALFKAGAWRHVAVSYPYRVTPPAGTGKWGFECLGVVVSVDGRPVLRLSGRQYLGAVGSTALVGNNAGRTRPFAGVVDELVVLQSAHGYYHWDRRLVDSGSQRTLQEGPPWFRSGEDLVVHAPFDASLEARCGSLSGSLAWFRQPDRRSEPVFADGLRAEGLMVGAKPGVAHFELKDGPEVSQGTIEFWFSPHDWDNRHIYKVDERVLIIPILRADWFSRESGKSGRLVDIDLPLSTEVKKLKAGTWYQLNPGTWYHMLLTWTGRSARLYVNGEPAEHEFFRVHFSRNVPDDARLKAVQFGEAGPWKRYNNQLYRLWPKTTVVDELRIYRTQLSRPEIDNAYARYLPDQPVKELPFAEIALKMNHPRRLVTTDLWLLAPEAERVAGVELRISDEKGNVIVDEALPAPEQARVRAVLRDRDVFYGTYTARYTFNGAQGKPIKTHTLTVERPRPPWLGNTLGIHEGEVLPGWTPMEYEDGTVSCWGRRIVVDGRGWPARIISRDKDILAGPVSITLKSGGRKIALKPTAPKPELIKKQDDIIVTRGTARGEGWKLVTVISTEFDGMMKVEATLSGPEEASFDTLTVDYPLRLAPDQLYGFWAGSRGFRGSCDYRRLPEGPGVVFNSNKTGRSHGQWQGRVSFIPYLTICDDWRGFVWLAENDRHWTQSWERPAQQIIRETGVTHLRLNIVQAEKSCAEPRTYVFGMQATPIKPLREDFRSFTRHRLSFGLVDGFNGSWLRSDDGGHTEFLLTPKGHDWSKVWARSRFGKKKLFLYLDRAWQRAPEDAAEFRHLWRGWGDATRHFPEVRDAYIYYMNEWMRRGFINGVYIDDVWIKPTLAGNSGLAYRREDGEMEWGVEFFDFRKLLKRLRWLFHDNGMEPVIWVHSTQTAYIPMLAFVDCFLEGEDRYLRPHSPKNFITSWGIHRIRFANGEKWGIPTNWLNNIGMRMKGPAEWFWRQRRAYAAALVLCDIQDVSPGQGSAPHFKDAGCYDDRAQFEGFWDPACPVKAVSEDCYASAYKLPDHIAVILVNAGKEAKVAEFTVDAGAVRRHLKSDEFVFVNADDSKPPADPDALVEKQNEQMARPIEDIGRHEEDSQLITQLKKQAANERKLEGDEGTEAFTDLNFAFNEGRLRLRIRSCDYRLLIIRRPEEE